MSLFSIDLFFAGQRRGARRAGGADGGRGLSSVRGELAGDGGSPADRHGGRALRGAPQRHSSATQRSRAQGAKHRRQQHHERAVHGAVRRVRGGPVGNGHVGAGCAADGCARQPRGGGLHQPAAAGGARQGRHRLAARCLLSGRGERDSRTSRRPATRCW